MFEAIHGSAPRMIEAGLGEYADTSSLLRAAEMMLRHITMTSEADRLAKALTETAAPDFPVRVTGNRDGATTAEFTDALLKLL